MHPFFNAPFISGFLLGWSFGALAALSAAVYLKKHYPAKPD